jgi:hypothetical protein
MTRILRYPEDRWPLAYTGMVLAVQLGLYFGVESLWVTAVCVLLFQPVQAVAIACNHYQHHINVLTVRWLNRAYEVVLFLQTGTPPFLITLHHNLGHHPGVSARSAGIFQNLPTRPPVLPCRRLLVVPWSCAYAVTNGNPGGKLPTGNLAVPSPSRRRSAASRNARTNHP